MGLGELLVILGLMGPGSWTVQPLPPLTLPVVVMVVGIRAAAETARDGPRDDVSRIRTLRDHMCACKDLDCVKGLEPEMQRLSDLRPVGSPEFETLAKEISGCVTRLAR